MRKSIQVHQECRFWFEMCLTMCWEPACTNPLHSFLVSFLLRKWPVYWKQTLSKGWLRWKMVQIGCRRKKHCHCCTLPQRQQWLNTTIVCSYIVYLFCSTSPSESQNSSHERFVVDTVKCDRTPDVGSYNPLSQDSDSQVVSVTVRRRSGTFCRLRTLEGTVTWKEEAEHSVNNENSLWHWQVTENKSHNNKFCVLSLCLSGLQCDIEL